jgi:biopolymer transport protein ExbB/TolQ
MLKMAKRIDLHAEKKKPNLSIPVGKTVYTNYPVHCANIFSSVSREVTLFVNKVIEENKIEEKYLEEPKKERFAISIEETKAKKFKEICERYKKEGKLNYYTTPITKKIEEQLKEVENAED